MHEALEPTQDIGWVLSHEGYNELTEDAVESRLAIGNGFLGVRAARSVSRGPTWAGFLGFLKWASWPRCYVAGLFDTPNLDPPVPALVPVADWTRVRILLDGEPLLLRGGETLSHVRTLDLPPRPGRSARPRTSPPRSVRCASSRSPISVPRCSSCASRWTMHAG